MEMLDHVWFWLAVSRRPVSSVPAVSIIFPFPPAGGAMSPHGWTTGMICRFAIVEETRFTEMRILRVRNDGCAIAVSGIPVVKLI